MKRVYRLFKNYIKFIWIKFFIFSLFFWIITTFIAVIEPLFFWEIIKYVEKFYISWNIQFDIIFNTIFFWVAIIILTLLLTYIYGYYIVDKKVLWFYMYSVKKNMSWFLMFNYWELLNKKPWSIYKILDRGADNEFNIIQFFYLDILKSLFWIFIIIWILFYIHWQMALISLSMLPVLFLFAFFFYKYLYPLQKKVDDDWEIAYGDFWNALTNFWLLKTLWLENNFNLKIKTKLDTTYIKQDKLNKFWTINTNYTALIIMFSRLLVLWFWIYFISIKTLTIAELFVIFSYLWWIYFPLSFIVWKMKMVQEQITSIEKMYNEIDTTQKEDLFVWENIDNVSWNIRFEKVNFSYTWEIQNLKNLSFDIASWEKIALVWDTWSGKSTIFNLLLRYWEVWNWWIYIDNKNIKKFSKNSLRNILWVVSQDNSLFNMTIKENLLLVKEDATNEEIENALKNAQANFVLKLKDGINTYIWERWLKLSWWEKQRISIARLFLKNPQIILLDEATRALDNKTENLIQKALDKLIVWKTSIIIAHRLTTITNVDKIYFLKDWNIVESGNYKELIDKKWYFYELSNSSHLMLN